MKIVTLSYNSSYLTAFKFKFFLLFYFLSTNVASMPNPGEELRRQQEREEQQQTFEPDVRLKVDPDSKDKLLLKQENPCFKINKITLQVMDEYDEEVSDNSFFNWALKAANYSYKKIPDSPIGRCLGADDINLVMSRIQNAIVVKGYITTRILAKPQDLKTGELKLTVIPGLIRNINFKSLSPFATASTTNAIASKAGELLNLRDIEQGLENFKRVPNVKADIQIQPSEISKAKPGDSDLLVTWEQDSLFRFNLSFDNAGYESTGKYQGGFTFSLDNLLTLNDLFYVSFNNDLGGGDNGKRGVKGKTFRYLIPYKYWLFDFTANYSSYHQTVAEITQDSIYSGKSDNVKVKLSHMIYRDAKRKTKWYLAGWARTSKNYVDDAEIEVQHRRMAGWEFGINHKEYIKNITLMLDFIYRRGTGALSSLKAPEENFNEGDSRPKIIQFNMLLIAPFTLGKQRFEYQSILKTQYNKTSLVPQDRFSIGSQYSVRGFDGENTLTGDMGLTLRNNLFMSIGNSNHDVYLGIDYGVIGGKSSKELIGKYLSGIAFGFRGKIKNLSYDTHLATAIKKPKGFVSDSLVFNFNINLGF